MFEKQQVERILAAYGLGPETPDDEIRSVLMKIEWHKDDIDSALYVLRENAENHTTHVDSLHQIFRRDERLHPETIKSLLGIDVEISSPAVLEGKKRKNIGYSLSQVVTIVIASLIVAFLVLLLGMWYMEAGLFHITM